MLLADVLHVSNKMILGLIQAITVYLFLQLWSAESGKCYHTYRGHTAEIVSTQVFFLFTLQVAQAHSAGSY